MQILTSKDIRSFSESDLQEKIITTKRMILNMRFKQATRQPIKTHMLRQYKKQLARLLTIESEQY